MKHSQLEMFCLSYIAMREKNIQWKQIAESLISHKSDDDVKKSFLKKKLCFFTENTCLLPPIIIIAGGCRSLKGEKELLQLITESLHTSSPRLYISGGTKSGICQAVAMIKKNSETKKNTHLVGFVPKKRNKNKVSKHNVPLALEYDEFRFSNTDDFSTEEVYNYWQFIEKELGATANSVVLFGIGGGKISLAEYEIALKKGAKLILLRNSGGLLDKFAEKNKHSKNIYLIDAKSSAKNIAYLFEKLTIRD